MTATLRVSLGILVIIIFVSFALAGYWFLSSSWLIWALLPANASFSYVIDTKDSSITGIFSIFDQNFTSAFASLGKKTERLGVGYTKSGIVIVLMPRLNQQLQLPPLLHKQGWRVERLGLAIRASKDVSGPLSSFKESTRTAASLMFFSRLPIRPLAILNVNSGGMTSQNQSTLVAIATKYDDRIRFISDSSFRALSSGVLLAGAPLNMQDAMNITVPGNVLSSLPAALRVSWNDYLHKKMGFSATSPDIIGQLAGFDRVSLTASDKDITISVQDKSNSFSNTVSGWLDDEERYARPVKRVFRLPDGALGYEQVPGKAMSVLGPVKDGCRQSIAGKTKYWLCAQDNMMILSSSEQLARVVNSNTGNNEWSIVINPALLSHSLDSTNLCSWCFFSHLSLFGSDQKMIGDLWGN